VIDVVVGGARRQESVRAGFDAFDRHGAVETGVVLVHDAARPLIEPALVGAVTAATVEHGAAIPIVPVAETLKRIEGELVGATVERANLGAAQTPQGVRRDLLREAYRRFPADGPSIFTDEAALLEACSIAVHVVPGDPGNLKVTLPGDLLRATAALAGRSITRTGIGHDSHPFGPDMGLRLGGIGIDAAPRLAGHSDGDVVLHAVADALLGAAGLGDLGRLFPADARTPHGIASSALIEEVRRRLESAGWRPATLDLTVIAARPRLALHLDRMRDSIASLLGLEPGAVNVKASSGNLDGAEGAGRSISALAIASVEATR
jgi:2-C-methyl-D-erythritol 4-phosphate cytidylyltransferase/2-C-methyl-D-erythritol 2,4-cyclodiphosphate synthase